MLRDGSSVAQLRRVMPVADFVAGAVREFLESADDDLWFQLLTIIRKSHDPGLSAVQTILTWVVTER